MIMPTRMAVLEEAEAATPPTRLKTDHAEAVLHVAGMHVYPERYEVRVGERRVPLTAGEMRVLWLLARRPGVVIPRESLLSACRGLDADEVDPRSINKRVQRLRKKLGPAGDAIVSVPGVGYVLSRERRSAMRRVVAGLGLALLTLAHRPRRAVAEHPRAAVALGCVGVAALLGGAMALNPSSPPGAYDGPPRLALLAVGELPNSLPHVREALGALGSGIAYAGDSDRYAAVSDRATDEGPGAGNRLFSLRLAVKGGRVAVDVLGSVRLRDANDQPFVGSGSGPLLDAEAVRIAGDRTIWIADEYGPSVRAFDHTGRLLRTLALPESFTVGTESHGILANRGLESLALAPAGDRAWTVTQSPLKQDGGEDGRVLRLLELPLDGASPKQFAYVLEQAGDRVQDLAALPDGSLLALERGRRGSRLMARLVWVRVDGAADASDVDAFTGDAPLPSVPPVARQVVLDLGDAALGLSPIVAAEQFEGLTLGPALPDGRTLVLLASDNDFNPERPTRFVAFAAELPRSGSEK